MKNKKKIIITAIICLIIAGLGAFIIFKESSTDSSNKESKEFIKAIDDIQNNNYVEAYNEIKDGNAEEKNIIQTIFLCKFSNQIDDITNIANEINDEFKHITNYLKYTYLYSKNTKYQANIDKIYAEKYPALYAVKEQMPKEIMFNDITEMYDLYFEYVEKSDGLFKNSENKLLNDNTNFSNEVTEVSEILTKYEEAYNEAIGNHPLEAIPSEYVILLDLND